MSTRCHWRVKRKRIDLLAEEDANLMRVTGEGVVAGGQTQAEDGRREKDTEHQFVNGRHGGVGGPHKEIDADENENEAAYAVCPDIERLSVQPKDGPKAGLEGRQRRPVAKMQIVVVL